MYIVQHEIKFSACRITIYINDAKLTKSLKRAITHTSGYTILLTYINFDDYFDEAENDHNTLE
jgi:hypothetical protein